MTRIVRWSLPVLVLSAGIGGAFLMVSNPASSLADPDAPTPDPLADAATVTTVSPLAGPHAPQLQLYARYQSRRSIEITSPITTEVDSVPVRVGDRVEAGQVLVRLDGMELQRQVNQLEARRQDLLARQALEAKQHEADQQAVAVERNLLDIARRSVERLRNLAQRNLSSASDLEAAERTYQNQLLALQQRELAIARYENVQQQLQAQLAELDSQLDQARATLDDATVTAPFAGRVSDVQAETGGRVSTGAPLLRLIDDRETELLAWAAAPALDRVADLTRLDGYLDGPDGSVPVTLNGYDPAADGGSLQLYFKPADTGSGLVLNRYYRLWLDLPRVSAWAVPDASVYSNAFVYRLDDNRLRRIPVQVMGERYQDGRLWRLVQGDLSADDALLATRLKDAAQGLAVKVAQP
ncbi:efflux RND transporter periplasmic adaptor subunit [Saccharospirillum salsuginis]|nr:HlyD family efflux transporter periplasmic adaptor subunit [Saccharospirillum salsuginis]